MQPAEPMGPLEMRQAVRRLQGIVGPVLSGSELERTSTLR